jgi:hypothetical protein
MFASLYVIGYKLYASITIIPVLYAFVKYCYLRNTKPRSEAGRDLDKELIGVAVAHNGEASLAARLLEIGELIVTSVLTILARVDDDDRWVGALLV